MIELDAENIRHVKLSSGEEVVGYISADTSGKMLLVHSPMKVTTTLNEKGFSFFFVQWQPLAKGEECLINPMHVISTVEIANDIKEKYVRLVLQLREQEDLAEDEFEEYDLEPTGAKSTTLH